MVAIRPQQANAFLANPDPAIRAVLFYGPDAGLVSERAKRLASRLAQRDDPAGEVVRFDEADLDDDPDRIAVELLTVPMFGGAKIVRTSTSRRVNAALLKRLLEGPAFAGALIVEAGALRADDAIKGLFEKGAGAAAIACYSDEGDTLSDLVEDMLRRASLKITPEARVALVARLGADRAMSRAEIEKLTLYATGAGTIDVEHVEAIVGDASEIAIDRVLAAVASGDVATTLIECDRAVASGENPQTILLFVQRHFIRLHRVQAAVESGRSVTQVMGQMRPPVYGRQQAALERELRLWTGERLTRALARISTAAKAARLAGDLEVPVVEALLLELARMAAAGRSAAPARR
jgi:DNA polymerase III subunit delta